MFLLQEEGVLRGQELENAVSDADYARAIQIAFELRKPHRLYDLLSELCRSDIFVVGFIVWVTEFMPFLRLHAYVQEHKHLL